MDISVSIKELLYKNDCVVIPGFGAFVLNYSSASINPLSNLFNPPLKEIIFNPSINRNDGLLTNYISEKLNASFDEATMILRDSVEELKMSLNKGKKVHFKGIGNFSINKEGKYQFECDDNVFFYLGSYGLTSFSSPAIDRIGIARKLEKRIKENDIEKKDRRLINTIVWSAAASILLIISFTWTALNTSVFKDINQNYTSIFNTLVPRIYNNDLNNEVKRQKSVVRKQQIAVSNQQTTVSNEQVINIEPKTQNPESETIITKSNLPTPESKLISKYYIIGGCFSIEENAHKFVEDLKTKGFNPVIIGKTKTGLIRVAYNSYDNITQANNELSNIHTSQNSGAWLLTTNN